MRGSLCSQDRPAHTNPTHSLYNRQRGKEQQPQGEKNVWQWHKGTEKARWCRERQREPQRDRLKITGKQGKADEKDRHPSPLETKARDHPAHPLSPPDTVRRAPPEGPAILPLLRSSRSRHSRRSDTAPGLSGVVGRGGGGERKGNQRQNLPSEATYAQCGRQHFHPTFAVATSAGSMISAWPKEQRHHPERKGRVTNVHPERRNHPSGRSGKIRD